MRKPVYIFWGILLSIWMAGCSKTVNTEEPVNTEGPVITEGPVNTAEPVSTEKPGEWYDNYDVICHALGLTEEGYEYTNSKEAFEYNYELGQRVFEVDLQLTSDNVMVLRHDWDYHDLGQGEYFNWSEDFMPVPTAEEFLAAPIYWKYTPLSLADWFEIMKNHPDIYMVTDSKFSLEEPEKVSEQFRIIVDTAIDNGYEDVLSRVIVQIYTEDMYEQVMEVYPFTHVIWTLYYCGYQDSAEMAQFCRDKEIEALAIPAGWWTEWAEQDMEPHNLRVFAYTVNNEAWAEDLLQRGVSGIYSDTLTNEQVAAMKKNGTDER